MQRFMNAQDETSGKLLESVTLKKLLQAKVHVLIFLHPKMMVNKCKFLT
jgi:hypothetical protein